MSYCISPLSVLYHVINVLLTNIILTTTTVIIITHHYFYYYLHIIVCVNTHVSSNIMNCIIHLFNFTIINITSIIEIYNY